MGGHKLTNWLRRFKAVEVSLLIYLLITLLLGLYLVYKSGSESGFIVIHLLLMALIVFVAHYNWLQTQRWFLFFRTMYPILLLSFLYTETDLINNLIFNKNLDSYFASFEQNVFGLQPSLAFASYIPSNIFAEAMYFGYFAYYLMLIGIPILFYVIKGQTEAEKVVFIILQSFLLFYLFFIVFPVAGPQYHFNSVESLPKGFLFGNLIRFIQLTGEAPTAAFPSSHVAMCLIIIYLTAIEFKRLVLLLVPVALLLVFSTVYIQAHYVIDILAAFVAAPLVYKLSLRIFHQINPYYDH